MRRWSPGKSSGSRASGGGGLYNASNARALLACYAKARPRAPSKWDDAQKWLSRAPADDGGRRSSGADDRLLLPSASQKGSRPSWSSAVDGDVPAVLAAVLGAQDKGDTKKVVDSVKGDVPAVLAAVLGAQDKGDTKRVVDSVKGDELQRFASLTLRDVGTEMTPGGSKEPSRTSTPRAALRATPAAARGTHVSQGGGAVDPDAARQSAEGRQAAAAVSPATAWDEAERAKHIARYRREELEIHAWENRERRNAELQMKMAEVKAERRKQRAQEKAAGKLATAQAVAKEKRARAEAKLSRRAARVSRGREGSCLLGRRRPRLPSSLLSLKLPLLCS